MTPRYIHYFSYFSTKTYVVCAQKNRLNEHPKHMIKQIDKEIIQLYALTPGLLNLDLYI